LVLVKLFTAGKTRKKFYQTGNSAFAGDLRPCAIALKQYFSFPVSIELRQGRKYRKKCCWGLLFAHLAVFLVKLLPKAPSSMRMGLGDSI
jgi:hypothetical protein